MLDDELQLEDLGASISFQRDIRNCNVCETWLKPGIPDIHYTGNNKTTRLTLAGYICKMAVAGVAHLFFIHHTPVDDITETMSIFYTIYGANASC